MHARSMNGDFLQFANEVGPRPNLKEINLILLLESDATFAYDRVWYSEKGTTLLLTLIQK